LVPVTPKGRPNHAILILEDYMADNLNSKNLSRRTAIAGGLTGAAGLIAGGARAAFAEVGNPEAELLEVCRQHDQLSAELDAFYKEQEVAYRRYSEIEPKKPEALRVQKRDKRLSLPVPERWDPDLKTHGRVTGTIAAS
jgi:hypothetical protein